MIRIKIEATSTYRLAGQSCEADGYPWHGRLLNTPQLEKLGKATEAGNPVREIGIEIANSDAFINLTTETLWGATVTLYNDYYAETWVGEIRSFSTTGEGVLSIMAAEETLAAFKSLLPDEIVRVSTWTEAARDAANTTIPTVFGGTAADPIRVRGILVDRVAFRYLFCVGEIREVVAVLKNREAITTGFTTYTGTAGQSAYPGFAYIEFDADPRDEAGTWPEILADVVGLKLGAATEEECRNPARILQYLLTTTRGGACGWGLGIPSGSLDSTSFTTAISDCDTAGFKIDGALLEQKAASFWIAQITNACRGSLRVVAGKWTLTIDKVSSSVAHYGDGQKKMRLQYFGKGASSERKNRHSLEYRYDATDGRLLGYVLREDSTSQTAIGVNESKATNLLVRDHTAAGYIVDYLSRYETYGENRIEFMTDDFDGVNVDSVITITRSDLGLSAAKFRVVSMRISGGFATIEARGYDDAIFDNDTPGTPPADPETDPTIPAAAPPNPPGVPADLSIQTNVRVQPDGTVIGYADISFTPAVAALFTRIEVGEGAVPESWVELGVIGESGIYHHEPAKVGQNYTYRLTSVNAGGSSAPVTANVTIAADTTAPLVPQTPVLSTFFKSIAVKCLQNLTKAPDHASFDVYRNTTNNSGTATKIGSAPCLGNTDSVVYLDEATAFDTTYYYWVKSVDTSGNISGFSAVAGPVSTQRIISGDIAAGALNTSALFSTGVVDAAAIADCAVTAAKTCIAAISRTTGNLNAGVVGTTQLVDCAIATAKLAAGAVTCPKIAAGAIFACHISASAVVADAIAAGAIVAGKLAAGSIYGCNIIAGTICSAQIGACQIAACNLAAGIITSEKIISTGITGACICAGTITASHLLVAAPGAALNDDPAFADSTAWVTCSGSLYFCTVTDGKVGTTVIRSPANGCAAWPFSTKKVPVDPSKTYRVRVWVRKSSTANGVLYVSWRTYNSAGTGIPANLGHYIVSGVSPGTAWTEYAVLVGYGTSWAATSDARTMNVGLGLNYAGTAGYMEAQDLRIEEVLPSTLIQDGAITTSKILANSICSGHICTGGISGACITAGSITADRLNVGKLCAITADLGTVTAGTLCTVKLCAATGRVGGFDITEFQMHCINSDCSFISLGNWPGCTTLCYPSTIYVGSSCTYSLCGLISLGSCLRTAADGWIGTKTGISVLAKGGAQAFQATFDRATGSNFCGVLGGISFSCTALYSSNYSAGSAGFCIGCGGNAEFNNVTVRGTVCATTGLFSNFCLCSDGFSSYANNNASYLTMRIVPAGYAGYALGYFFAGGNLGKTNCYGYGSSCVVIQGGLNGCDYFNAPVQVLLGCGSACVAFYSNGCIRVASVCCSSDRNAKENIVSVSVLGRIRNLPISEWSFKGDLIRHVGPMAQDFYEVFKGYSSDPKAIGGLDGIALKGVQELDGCVESLKSCITSLEDRLCNLETRFAAA